MIMKNPNLNYIFKNLEKIDDLRKYNEAPTQQAVGYLPIGLIDVASGDSSQSLQAAGYLNENEISDMILQKRKKEE